MTALRGFDCPVTETRCDQELCKKIGGILSCQLDSAAATHYTEEQRKKILAFREEELSARKYEQIAARQALKREERDARKRLEELKIRCLFDIDPEVIEEFQALRRRFND